VHAPGGDEPSPEGARIEGPAEEARAERHLVPYLPVALHDELGRRQFPNPDRPAGMNPGGRDPHLGAHAELIAVDQTGRRVDEDGGRVDLAGEPARAAATAR